MGDSTPFNKEAEIMNFNAGGNAYVKDYIHQSAMELYASPVSEGNIIFDVNQDTDIVVQEDEFFAAVTLTQFEKCGVDIPLCVTKVT